MDAKLPSKRLKLLNSLLGKEIKYVCRQLFKEDRDIEDYEQAADGPIELTLTDGTILHFIADTETFSIAVSEGKMPKYGESYEFSDISGNSFWIDRVNIKIIQVICLKSYEYSEEYPSEFGLEMKFSNGLKAFISYKDQDPFVDTINVSSIYQGGPCFKLELPEIRVDPAQRTSRHPWSDFHL